MMGFACQKSKASQPLAVGIEGDILKNTDEKKFTAESENPASHCCLTFYRFKKFLQQVSDSLRSSSFACDKPPSRKCALQT